VVIGNSTYDSSGNQLTYEASDGIHWSDRFKSDVNNIMDILPDYIMDNEEFIKLIKLKSL